MSRVWI